MKAIKHECGMSVLLDSKKKDLEYLSKRGVVYATLTGIGDDNHRGVVRLKFADASFGLAKLTRGKEPISLWIYPDGQQLLQNGQTLRIPYFDGLLSVFHTNLTL